MKKLCFVLAFMLMGTFGFAGSNNEMNNEIEVNEVGICTYSIEYTTTFLGVEFTTSTTYTVEASSYSDCVKKQKAHVAFLNAQ